ncbi:hypothetical protein OAI36_00380 [Alphaproteobacteria bacterium]|nr:hypothetical protein [Alphaproteobacteria bacterium]
MAVDSKTNVTVQGYTRSQYPVFEEGMRRYLQEELQRLENAVRQLQVAAIVVADVEPENKIRGMVRYAISPWNPLSNSYSGLVVYNGSAWVAV